MNARVTRVARVASAAVMVALTSGCSFLLTLEPGKLPGEACVDREECVGETAQCESAQCTLPCEVATDCPETTTCLDQRCTPAGEIAFGDRCGASASCATGLCEDGLCVSPCESVDDCPNGAVCAADLCQPVLRAGFVFDAIVSNASSGFAHTHNLGRQQVEQSLPWLQTSVSEGNDPSTVNMGIDRLIDDDVDVMFVTSGRFGAQAAAKALTYPDTQFFTYSAPTSENHVGFAARFHQAWYIAGIVAGTFDASVTQANTIGFVAPIAASQVIRELNAFALGVRSVAPNTDVEVIWANTFVPSPTVTEGLVDYLVEGGNRIIVNRLGSRYMNDYVDTLTSSTTVYSIAVNDEDACIPTPNTCLGAPYWNWGVLYEQILRSVRDGSFDASNVINDAIELDPTNSSFHFALNEERIPELRSIAADIATAPSQMVGPNGEDLALQGPYCVSVPNQRQPSCVDDGAIISDEELATMCWLVEGIVQRSDTEDPSSPTIPAIAPDGTIVWPPQIVDPASIARPNCR